MSRRCWCCRRSSSPGTPPVTKAAPHCPTRSQRLRLPKTGAVGPLGKDVSLTTSPASEGLGALAGVRIVDLTAVVLGPIATQILGDYGADIVKVESPSGDLMRLN